MESPFTIHAEAYARTLHRDQRYGADPYWVHLKDVADEVAAWAPDYRIVEKGLENLIAAAWLHDSIEDQHETREHLADLFNPEVARLVWAVSNEPGRNRRERHEKTYPKIQEVGKAALILKLADRIANVRTSMKQCKDPRSQGLLQMYWKEWPGFQQALRRYPGELPGMWRELEELMVVEK